MTRRSEAAERSWRYWSSDPNSPAIRRSRTQRLRASWSGVINDRTSWFADQCATKEILDLGCVDQLPAGAAAGPLHRALASTAKSLLGVDIEATGACELRGQGYDVKVADIARLTSPETIGISPNSFDVVVAGELVEHLDNVGDVFSLGRANLRPAGQLLMSTPNPYGLHSTISGGLLRTPENGDHVVYVHPQGVLELAARHGFALIEVVGVVSHVRSGWLYPLVRSVSSVARLWNRFVIWDCVSLIYSLELQDPANSAG